MLKTTGSSKLLAPKTFKVDNNKIIKVSNRANKMCKNFSMSKKLKNTKSEIQIQIIIRATRERIFLLPSIKNAFYCLKHMFFKALIL